MVLGRHKKTPPSERSLVPKTVILIVWGNFLFAEYRPVLRSPPSIASYCGGKVAMLRRVEGAFYKIAQRYYF